MVNNISTGFSKDESLIQRDSKEKLLKQKAKVLWLTGLSGSGKSTIAFHLEQTLFNQGFFTQLFDGDIIRKGLNKDLGFSLEDRAENIRRIVEVSKIFLNCGIIVINCFVSPTREIRSFARQTIGEEDFYEIFVNTPLSVCEKRDVKGLYAKARKGLIKDFTGIDSPYEEPLNPDFEISGNQLTVDECIEKLLEFILPKIKL